MRNPRFISVCLLGATMAIGSLALGGVQPPNAGEDSIAAAPASAVTGRAQVEALSLDALYQIPSPIGREPGGVAWSRDARRLAFLWNDKGGTFRDIWVYERATGDKRQLTQHAGDFEAALEHAGIGELRWFGPDDDELAYTLEGQLYIVNRNGKQRAVAKGLEGIHQLAGSPDGKNLSFVAAGGADNAGGRQVSGLALWLLRYQSTKAGPQKSATPRLLLDPGHPDSSVKSHQWGRDGRQVSFELQHMGDMAKREIHYYQHGELQVDTVSRAFPGEPNMRFAVGVLDTASGESRLLERQNDRYPVWGYGLAADGSKLFVNESDPYVKLHRIEMYELGSGKRQTFYQERDPKHLRPDWKAKWAPGDKGLIILTDRDGFGHLYHQRRAGDKAIQLTSGDWEISDFAVADNERQLYFRANKAQVAERQLYRVPLAGGDITRVSPETPGTHKLSYAPDMRSAASVFSNDSTPPELYVIDFDKRQGKRLTVSPTAGYQQQRWADVRYIEFNSHVDGTPLIGRLSLPPGFKPDRSYPLIVGSVYSDSARNQWGGRTAHPTWGLDQHLVAQGYILLNVNVRGSWGQGREHNQGLLNSYGNIDIDDLHSGVLHLVEQGYADPARVGIWGSSYGGLMTMMSLFKKPDVYAVGIAGAPATNVWHAYPEQMWVMGPAEGKDMPERYRKQSPLFHTGGLEDPLMIIHGNRDEVVLYADTIAVVNKLIAGEQDFELVTLPGAGHGWDAEMNDQRLFSFRKMVEYFNRHLKPGVGESP